MKLVLVASALDSQDGWASYTAGLARGLTSLGVRITALLDRRARADVLPEVRSIPCLSSPLGALDRPAAMAWNAARLVRHARGADLLHFTVEPYATASLAPGLPPHCVTVHGTYASAPFGQGRLTRTLYGAALRRARTVVCVSRYTRDRLLERLPLGNTAVIPNGHALLPDAGEPDRERLAVDGRPLLLGVGALKPRKGYDIALRAVARLRERFPDLRYYLVGDDADRAHVASLRAEIAALGLGRHAVITGPVSAARLRALYRAADLFVLTPVNVGRGFEGFGIAYLEAGAFGLPVVASDGCGAAEAVADGESGLLAPQGDAEAVAERAARILADPALAARLGRAGRARAAGRTWAAVAAEYLAAYERALAQ